MPRSLAPLCRRTAIAVAIALSFLGTALAATANPIDDRANELLAWVAKKTGYSADHVKVTVLVVDPTTIERIAYTSEKATNIEPEALTTGQTVFLPKWFALGKNDDILVHELTHVLQFANDAQFPCRAAKERQAYETQSAFVDETHIGKKPDKFAVFLLQCSSYSVHYEAENATD